MGASDYICSVRLDLTLLIQYIVNIIQTRLYTLAHKVTREKCSQVG